MLFKLFWILLSLLDCGVKICYKPCQAKPARCTCLLYCGAAIIAVEAAGVVADFSSSTVVCFCVLLFVAVLYAVTVAHFVLLQSMLLLINASIVGQVMLICNLTQ